MKSNTLLMHERLAGAALALLTGVAGMLALSPAVTDMDGAEFALVAARGGIAHPPGYPLYSAMLRAWHELVAARMATAPEITSPPVLAGLSVLMSIATAILIWRATLAVNQNKTPRLIWVTALVTGSIMVSTPVLRASTAIEPFALNNLMAAALMRLAASVIVRRSGSRSFATGLLFGLAFCNHHSLAFAFPLAIALLPERIHPKQRNLIATLQAASGHAAIVVAGFLSGCLPMAWFFLERFSTTGPVWGDWTIFWPQLMRHLLRAGYGTFQLTSGATGSVWSGPWFMLRSYGSNLGLLLPVSMLGCALLFRAKSKCRLSARFSFLIAVCFLSSGMVMPLMFRQEFTPASEEIMSRFTALPLLFLSPLLSLGIARLADLKELREVIESIRHRDRGIVLALLAGLALIIPALVAPVSTSQRSRRNEIIANAHLDTAMVAANVRPAGSLKGDQPLPAIVVTTSDLDYFGVAYKNTREVPGSQPAILIQSGLWSTRWHRKQVLSALEKAGIPLAPAKFELLTGQLEIDKSFQMLAELLKTLSGVTPVNLATGTFPGIAGLEEPSFPLGPFIRVVGGESQLPPHAAVMQINQELSKILVEKIGARHPSTAWEDHALDGWRRSRAALGLPPDPVQP